MAEQQSQGLVNRLHVIVAMFVVALGVVGLIKVAPDVPVPLHWGHSAPDLTAPPELAFAPMPIVAAVTLAGFYATERLMPRQRLEMTRHLLDPALSALLAVTAIVQAGLLMVGMGSEIDLIRFAAFGLAAPLLLLGVLFPEAQRDSYAGLRLPWPIASDRVWRRAHRAAGIAFVLAAIALAVTAWLWPDPINLIPAMFAAMLVPPLVAAIFSLGGGSGAPNRSSAAK